MTSETSANCASPEHIDSPGCSPHTFQVDLRGLVDLLSHHLYSSPRVYLRELLQNAVDAITARRAEQPDAPALVRLYADDGRLRGEDSGIGLTETDVHSLLATIGRSSKRDGAEGLASARAGFLGRFGIGLLACFVVAAEIRVVSRSARTPAAPPVEWCARDDGSYTVRTLPDDARTEPGTTVHLTARPGSGDWLTGRRRGHRPSGGRRAGVPGPEPRPAGAGRSGRGGRRVGRRRSRTGGAGAAGVHRAAARGARGGHPDRGGARSARRRRGVPRRPARRAGAVRAGRRRDQCRRAVLVRGRVRGKGVRARRPTGGVRAGAERGTGRAGARGGVRPGARTGPAASAARRSPRR